MEKPKLKIANASTYRLSPYCQGYEALIVGWYDRPENAEFFRRCPPICDWLAPGAMQTLFGSLWIAFEDGVAVGLVGLFNADRFSRSIEFGLLVDSATVKDRDSCVQAIFAQACDYCFNYMNLHKISIRLMPWRDKLAKRLESQGFSKEADLRDSCFFNGEYHSEMLYSCLKLEYKKRSI